MSTFTSAEVEKLTTIGNEVCAIDVTWSSKNRFFTFQPHAQTHFSCVCCAVAFASVINLSFLFFRVIQNAALEWHATWNASEYPAPDGNDTTYLRKFLFMTYQDRKFCVNSGKNVESSTSTSSTKSKKSTTTPGKGTSSKSRETPTQSPLPQPEPLSNILGPNIPSIDFGTPTGGKATRTHSTPTEPKREASLIDLMNEPSVPATRAAPTSPTSSSNLLGDLMSLSVAPAPTATYASPTTQNPFSSTAAPISAPAVDLQQLAQLQTQVQNMQTAIMSAKQQMTAVQEQIQRGQQLFQQLTPQQKEQLSALMQRYQAMNTQFQAMNQQYTAAATKLQQMQQQQQQQQHMQMQMQMQMQAQPPQKQTNLFDVAFGAPQSSANSHGISQSSANSNHNLYAAWSSSAQPTATSATNGSHTHDFFGSPQGYSSQPAANTSFSHSQPNLFGNGSAPLTPTSNSNTSASYGSYPTSSTSRKRSVSDNSFCVLPRLLTIFS